MLFTQKLRDRVESGEVTASVRIWKTARVKVGGRYRLGDGHIEVISIREISWEDLTDGLARKTGFRNLVDLMRTAKHGSGHRVYYVQFQFSKASSRRSGSLPDSSRSRLTSRRKPSVTASSAKANKES
jgi:hypothetical protein